MQLWEELEKLYLAVKEPVFVQYRRHPCQLRLVSVGRENFNRGSGKSGPTFSWTLDHLTSRHYID